MIYIIQELGSKYIVYDARADVIIQVKYEELRRLLSIDGNYLMNGTVYEDRIAREKFINDDIIYNKKNIIACLLVGEVDEGIYAIKIIGLPIKVDRNGIIKNSSKLVKMDKEGVREILYMRQLLNCGYKDGKYISEYTIEYDREFKQDIDKKYERFINKSALLGNNKADIRYIVLGRDVLLTKLKSSGNCNIPNFITSILKESVDVFNRSEVVIGNNVKCIGNKAMYASDIRDIKINDNLDYVYEDSIYTYGNEIVVHRAYDNIGIDKVIKGSI